MKPDLSGLARSFEFKPHPALARVPLWAWGLLVVLVPMTAQMLPYWFSLPLPYGKLIGPDDPDPWLRLTLVRDWLTGGSWYSHLMLHSNTPYGGISSPWTRPLDVVIAALVFLQAHSAPLNIELIRAALMLPILWMTLLMGGLFRIMHNLRAAPVAIFVAMALIVTMPPIWNYFGIGNSDHHSMLAALWVWALSFHFERAPGNRSMLLSGLLFALMCWISVEAMMLIAIVLFFLGLAWLLDEAAARHMPVFATSVALGTWLAVLIERPVAQWFTPIYDSVSVVQAFALTLAAIVSWMLAFASPTLPTMKARLGAAIVDVGLLLAILWRTYPLFFHGPMATVDPFIITGFLPRINEAQPLDSESWIYVVGMVTQPLLAIFVCITQLRSKKGIYSPTVASFMLFVVVVTLALYCVEVRWFYYLYPTVAIILAPWLAALETPKHPNVARLQPAAWIAKRSLEEQLLWRMPLLLVVFFLPLVMMAFSPDRSSDTSRRIDRCQKEARFLIYGGKLEQLLGPKPLNLLAPTDLGGEIFFWTDERLVASNYHREGKSIQYVWDSDKVTSDAALRRYLAKRDIQALLICPASRSPKDSVLVDLQNGTHKVPPWLTELHYKTDAPRDAQPGLFLLKP